MVVVCVFEMVAFLLAISLNLENWGRGCSDFLPPYLIQTEGERRRWTSPRRTATFGIDRLSTLALFDAAAFSILVVSGVRPVTPDLRIEIHVRMYIRPP
jgi:hypothetical protein